MKFLATPLNITSITAFISTDAFHMNLAEPVSTG